MVPLAVMHCPPVQQGETRLPAPSDRKCAAVVVPVPLMADLRSGAAEPLRSLEKAVSELLERLAEELLALLERRAGRSLGRLLRLLLRQRLSAAAQRIVGLLERQREEDRRQLERQRRLLDAVLFPVVRLGPTGEIYPD